MIRNFKKFINEYYTGADVDKYKNPDYDAEADAEYDPLLDPELDPDIDAIEPTPDADSYDLVDQADTEVDDEWNWDEDIVEDEPTDEEIRLAAQELSNLKTIDDFEEDDFE